MNCSRHLGVLLALAVLLSGCGEKKDVQKVAAVALDPNVIVVDETLAARVKVGTIGREEVSEELRVPGSVGLDERRVARIGSSVTGRITKVLAFRGDEVKAGQTLAILNSTELANGQMQFLTAVADVELKTRAVERAKQLLAADVIGSAELQRRENELFSAEVAMKAARDQLRLMGMSPGAIDGVKRTREIDSVAAVNATMSGSVIDRQINQGQVVQPADAMFTVADLEHVWIEGEVPEQQAYLVEMGEEVRIELPALPGRRVTGKIIFISSTVNPATRTVQVRTDVVNSDRAIKPAMLANLLIRGVPQKQMVVPITAVVREANRDHVFARTGENEFRLVPVALGQESGSVVVLKDGLGEGDAIVVDGAFHLNNERKRRILG
ncbi:MAG TPA: efflux RND transporter periplasmic adaptor subunit [Burkholderiales bacterium]|nr:efflux RND transporter periplasmic adaptor subunit [Burkholderiales bacterium]